jgi:hypothetical protein
MVSIHPPFAPISSEEYEQIFEQAAIIMAVKEGMRERDLIRAAAMRKPIETHNKALKKNMGVRVASNETERLLRTIVSIRLEALVPFEDRASYDDPRC